MKYLWTFLLFASSYMVSFGQYNEILKQDIFGNPMNPQNQMYINMMDRDKSLKNAGETSLYDEWKAIQATGTHEVSLSVDSANYNYATDQFYFTHQGKLFYLDSEKVKTVKIGPDNFGIYTYQMNKDHKSGFLQILVDGDFPLLKRVYLKKTIVNDHPMKLPQANRTVFEKTTELYYIDKKTETVEKLPKSKKKFINLFRKRQAKLIRFAEEQKISLNDENDVARFFEYNKSINSDENQ